MGGILMNSFDHPAARNRCGQTPRGERNMERFIELLERLNREEEGQNLVEYAMLVALIALIALIAAAGVGLFGQEITSWFSDLGGDSLLT
jgi:Flp pilus assembly pilin Flp